MAGRHSEIVALIESVIGVSLTDEEIARTVLPLARDRAGALGLNGAAAYLEALASEPRSGREWSRLIAAVTNGQTCFFRDADQFAALRRLLTAARRERPGRRLAIWSSACSTGEEPYSIAILCAEVGVSAELVASDVNPDSLARARIGRYRSWSLRNVSAARAARWFSGPADDHQIDDRIRGAVRFVRHNLVRDPPLSSQRPDGRWDIVLCRNVLIYFRRERVARVCDRLLASLGAGGALVIAASETLNGLDVAARPEVVGNRIIYRKETEPPEPIREVASRPPAAAPVPTSRSSERVARLAIAGEIEKARQILRGAAAAGSVELELTLGHLEMLEHRFDAALEHYQQASEIDPLLCEAHYFLGLVHRKRAEWRQAVAALRRALFLTPTFWQASYLLAGAYQRIGRSAEAAREQARTRELLDGPPPIMTFLSDPRLVDRLGVRADEVRRAWSISRSR